MASVNSNITLNTGTDKLRNDLYARNLYAPDTEYPLQNEKNVDRVVGAINTVIKGITPFSSYDLTNTVYGRLITSDTPLTQIGLEMLGKQFALNSMSSIAQNHFPTIKVANLFDGSKDTKLFTKKQNFSITKKEGQTNFQTFLNNAVYYYPAKDYPFNKDADNSEFIRNTGPAQLNLLYNSINRNIYKQNSNVLYEYAKVADTQIFPRIIVIADHTYFNFNDGKFDPYAVFTPNTQSMVEPNTEMVRSGRKSGTDEEYGQEYAPSTAFIDKYFGEANKIQPSTKEDLSIPDGNTWIDENVEFSGDKIQNKIIWGIGEDVTDETKEKLKGLRPGVSSEAYNSGVQSNDLSSHFNIRAGLLEYTKNLINASEGRIGDVTRKAFIDKEGKLTGFQGSALWKSNNSVYATARQLAGKSGTRQHTALDQYDRFVKTIRFNGNEVYNGSPNSVIYKSVLPKIHPTMDENKVDNTDMMFSIENLAVNVINNGNYGIIDDEWGSAIPLCEVGPFGGRMMWFPPYNLEINENATAKYEPTVMIGRNEPMYNYMYSERGATLSFSLIIDYPEQLRNFKGGDRQREIAEFFAFGGEEYKDNTKKTIESLELKISRLQVQIDAIEGGGTVTAEPDFEDPNPVYVYFPNDVPKVSDDINSVINKMFNDYKYEITKKSVSSDGGTFGLNNPIYLVTGMTEYNVSGKTYYSASTVVEQYDTALPQNQFDFGFNELNKMLIDTYGNETNRPLYKLNIVGTASKLYTEQITTDVVEEEVYNEALGLRRANAIKELIEGRLQAIFNKNSTGLGITISIGTIGSEGASVSGATAAAIPLRDTKLERSASVSVVRSGVTPLPKEAQLSEEDRQTILELQKEIEAATTELSRLKGLAEGCVYEERPIPDNESGSADTGILHGFKGVSGNYYQPVFHSQTPEDFHKRLTFLQQCTRQGSAKKYDLVNEDGNLRAKNSVFGRQPICVLRVGDFFYTKIVLETVTVDYADTTWDMNPEGFGMQPMIANVTLNMKLIGGQSLKGPIDALQNANSYNFYANSNYTSKGMYGLPSRMAEQQAAYRGGIETAGNLTEEPLQVEDLFKEK